MKPEIINDKINPNDVEKWKDEMVSPKTSS